MKNRKGQAGIGIVLIILFCIGAIFLVSETSFQPAIKNTLFTVAGLFIILSLLSFFKIH